MITAKTMIDKGWKEVALKEFEWKPENSDFWFHVAFPASDGDYTVFQKRSLQFPPIEKTYIHTSDQSFLDDLAMFLYIYQ